LVIDVFAQAHTGIGRQAATIEVKSNRFGPNWRQMQGLRLKVGGHIRRPQSSTCNQSFGKQVSVHGVRS
jgi:hypothetical protein